VETNLKSGVILKHDVTELHVKPATSLNQKKIVIEKWHREDLKELVSLYIHKWEKKIKVQVEDFGVRKMKAR